MSVDYNAIIARGWRVTNEEWNEMNEASEYKYEDEFIGADYVCLNHEGAIFGERVMTIECDGQIWPIDNDDIDAMRKMRAPDYWYNALMECGRLDLAQLQPQLYFIGQVA